MKRQPCFRHGPDAKLPQSTVGFIALQSQAVRVALVLPPMTHQSIVGIFCTPASIVSLRYSLAEDTLCPRAMHLGFRWAVWPNVPTAPDLANIRRCGQFPLQKSRDGCFSAGLNRARKR